GSAGLFEKSAHCLLAVVRLARRHHLVPGVREGSHRGREVLAVLALHVLAHDLLALAPKTMLHAPAPAVHGRSKDAPRRPQRTRCASSKPSPFTSPTPAIRSPNPMVPFTLVQTVPRALSPPRIVCEGASGGPWGPPR